MIPLLVPSWFIACGWFDAPAPPPPPPTPEPAPVEVVAPPAAPATATVEWPLWRYAPVPAGRSAALPAGARLLDLDLDPQGRWALLVVDAGSGPRVWAWAFEGDPAPVKLGASGRVVHELQSSPLRDELFAITATVQGTDWAVERLKVAGNELQVVAGVLSSPQPLSSLVAPALIYEPYAPTGSSDRVFVSAELGPGQSQVLSVMSDGSRAYELTAPSGVLGERSAAVLRELGPEEHGPNVLAVPSARPLSVDPFTGELLWADAAGAVHGLAWSSWGETPQEQGNWGTDRVLARGGDLRVSPNGSLRLGWSRGQAGVRLLDRDGTELGVLALMSRYAAPPEVSGDGRTLVGLVDSGAGLLIETTAADQPLLAMRYLDQSGVSADERQALLQRGLQVAPSQWDQLYRGYEEFLYASPEEAGPPVFASIDGSLEVLYAGFEAVFLRVEDEVSRPRLEALLLAMQAASARGNGMPRVAAVADATLRVLHGDYAHPEGERILAELPAHSDLLGDRVDYGDFHPRGPYAARERLSHYFRAFKLMNQFALDPEERQTLMADPQVEAAWKAWTSAQQAMVYPSRRQGALQASKSLPPYVTAECVPWRVREAKPQMYPLSWGIDSEILQATVQQLSRGEEEALAAGRSWAEIDADTTIEHTPAHCTVRDRLKPSGLDLLAGLGSASARAWMAAETSTHPDLAQAHSRLAARFGGAVDDRSIAGSWLRLVQLLSSEDTVPEGVSPDLWRARLAETALASWTSFRYTTVLLQETTSAEAGGGGEGFERLVVEPGRGIVDPVPAAWSALSTALQRLAQHGATAGTDDRLVEVLQEAARNAADMGLMAARQQAGEPLAREEYERILHYARAIEHPFLLLKSSVPEDGALTGPAPIPRIVDIHTWTAADGSTQIWHAAVGHPQKILVLGGDRGVLVPARGAVYSWYEQVAGERLDDAAWQARVDAAERPAWVVAARQ